MNATTGTTGRAATPAGNGGQTAPPALPRQMMQAIVLAGCSSADVLHVEETGRPATGDGEALVGSTPPGSTGARGT